MHNLKEMLRVKENASLILKKEISKLQSCGKELEEEIHYIKRVMSMEGKKSYFEEIFKSKYEEANSVDVQQQVLLEETSKERKRAPVTTAIVRLLSDGVARDNNEIFLAIKEKINTTHDSVKTIIQKLKKSGQIESVYYGKYQIKLQKS